MSVIYNTQYVDEKYSAIIEPNLYFDSVLIPGVTYDDRYEEQAGGIFIHKLGTAGIIAPTTPGSDFSSVVVADTLIQAVFNNNFKRSRKVYGVTAAAVAYNKAEAELAEALNEVKQGWMISGLACLADESTNMSDTTAITTTVVEAQYLATRQKIRVAGAKPDFCLASPAVYTCILQVAGDNFRPVANEAILGQASVGNWYGANVIEANGLGHVGMVTYYNYAGSLISFNLTHVDYIMGDHRAFSVLNNFEVFRIIDSEVFAGSLAQVEFNTAYRVTNAASIVTKFNADPHTV
jgi:hypothetical protein